MIMARLGGRRFLKVMALLCLVLLPLTLVLAEAASCHPDNDQCGQDVCCLPCLVSAVALPHLVQVFSYSLLAITSIAEIFALTTYHPPRI